MTGGGGRTGTIKVGGQTLAYDVRGQGPAVLLIAGLGTGRWVWDRQVPALARHFTVVTYDHRGVGESRAAAAAAAAGDEARTRGAGHATPGAAGYSIRDLADDAAGLLRALGLPRAHVVGISMGGFVAQTLAIEHPDRVDRLILCATSFGGPESVRTPPGVWRDYLGLGDRPAGEALPLALAYHFGPDFPRAEPRLADLAARSYLLRREPAATIAAQADAATGFDESRRVGSIQARTLVAHGTADRILPVENARLLAGRIPGARLVLYEGAGHAFIVERAREFNRDVVAFLH